MGYIRHHAIVVTGYRVETTQEAHEEAGRRFAELPASVSAVTPVAINGYCSFFVAPDGSKESWDNSDACDVARARFVEWLRQRRIGLDWVEVQFGDDEGHTEIVNHSDDFYDYVGTD